MFGMVDEKSADVAEAAKKQGERSALAGMFGSDLGFDPSTGQFKVVSKFGDRSDVDIVTEMTEKGFAL